MFNKKVHDLLDELNEKVQKLRPEDCSSLKLKIADDSQKEEENDEE